MSKKTNRLILAAPNSSGAESYMALRTNLAFAGKGEPVKTLLIAGATEGCGKSTVALNLGHFAAAGGKSVVLIDGDMRKLALTRHFDCAKYPGLSMALTSQGLSTSPLRPTTTPRLWILPSGPIPPSSANLLASPNTGRLIQSLAEAYDLVIVDSPPVLAVADASILATLVDGIIVVADAKHSKRRDVRRAVDMLLKVHGNVLGLVVNQATGSAARFQYTSYGI
jgi:capsular exopolysaccharide synthesis family protein